MEEEYVSDFKSMDNDKYVNLNDINKCLDDVREDTFEDSNIYLNSEYTVQIILIFSIRYKCFSISPLFFN